VKQFIEAADSQPVVPWFQRINQVVSSGISMERRVTKRRLNRRNPDFGFGRVNLNTTRVCFIIDTSGSMADAELAHIDAELRCLSQLTEEPLTIVHCDANVAKSETYRYGTRLQEFFGRGGTSFEPALQFVKEMDEPPDLVCYFTDGYGGRLNDDEPILHPALFDVLWILTPGGMDEEKFKERITSLGEVIKIEDWNT
jgi:predicted metal-dependent peptidase